MNKKYVYAVYFRNRYPAQDSRMEFDKLTEAKRWSKRLAKSCKYVTLQKESEREITIYESWYDGKKR